MKTTESNKLIAEFMGARFRHLENIDVHQYNFGRTDGSWKTNKDMKYHSSWDWLMPVVRKIVELCCDETNDDLFESDYYTSILETVSLAIIEDAYKVVVEFIKWYNENN